MTLPMTELKSKIEDSKIPVADGRRFLWFFWVLSVQEGEAESQEAEKELDALLKSLQRQYEARRVFCCIVESNLLKAAGLTSVPWASFCNILPVADTHRRIVSNVVALEWATTAAIRLDRS